MFKVKNENQELQIWLVNTVDGAEIKTEKLDQKFVVKKEEVNDKFKIGLEVLESFNSEIAISDTLSNTKSSGNKKGEKRLQCSVCPRKFPYKSELKQHIGLVHEGKKPFKCQSCDFKSGYKKV